MVRYPEGVCSRLPPKHEVSTPVNEIEPQVKQVSGDQERERADIILTLTSHTHKYIIYTTNSVKTIYTNVSPATKVKQNTHTRTW
jgi:hypothetical protein